MRLSIVIPVLNEAAGIAPALERLAPLRRGGAEVIVADGGSTDATASLAAPHCDRVIVAPRGRAAQMNAGAAAASGDAILFLHADTQLPAGADRLIRDGLADGAHVWGRFDVTIDGPPALAIVGRMMNLRSRATGIATGDQAIFVIRDAFERAGRFPEIALMEDIALSARLKNLSRPLCLSARAVTSGRRWQRHGVLRTILLMWRLRFDYWRGADPQDLARRYADR
ncbi:MAG: TIGR04283 family arsenosugar biosynthesis glycosyltransferase [Xanthobacteraceae bacterium]|uniref:TIGR04283 family arsenosugar biosynthesis glycosyltransferase n=1 Tax=Pseudolabrys sp. TaxID=1960880 RepID=UPI003D0A81AF